MNNQDEKILETNNFLTHVNFIIRHDLYNSINLIHQFYDKIDNKIEDNDLEALKILGAFKILGKCITRLKETYKGIYDLSLMIDDNKELPKETFDLYTPLLSHLKNTAYYSYIELDKSLGNIHGNQSLVITAIMNIIKNGITHNNSDNKKVCIYRSKNDLIISDNGIGMTQEQFDEFVKPHIRGDMNVQGSGLGLAISKLILKHHNAPIRVETKNVGTKIVIENLFHI